MLNSDFIKVKLPLILYIFFFLFAPPIIKDINVLLFLFVFSFITILVKYRKELKEIIKIKNIKKIGLMVIGYYVYYFLTIIINSIITGKWYFYNYFINTYSMLLVLPISVICALHIIFYMQRKNITFNDLIKLIIICGLIQSAITMLAFLFPAIKELLIKIMYNNTGEELYLNQYHIERRCFGFANSLLDSFGFGTGILAVLPLFYSINNGKKWLASVPFLLMVPLVNSRTGLIIFAIGVLFWFLYIIKNKMLKKYLDVILLIITFVCIFVLIIGVLSPKTITWIRNDFSSFFTDKKGTADILFGADFWKLPNLVNCIFGTGYSVAGHTKIKDILGFSSDVGYINEIWKTGIIGLGLLVFTLIVLVKFSNKKLPKEYKNFMCFVVVAVLIANIKFSVFSYSPGIVIILLISLYALLTIKNNKYTNSEDSELISIVIPIYNVEKYLSNCLNSIVNQTYKNLEIILINDGSKDNSSKICKEFLEKDSRIKYIEQENQGLSAARNNGFMESTAKYIIFVDSDDYVNVNFVEELYTTLINTNSDIAICNYSKVYDSKSDIYKNQIGVVKTSCNIGKFYNLYNDKKVVTTVAWNKIYKREIFEKIKYPVGKIHEDEYIIYDVLNNSNKVAYTSCEYYYYLQRQNSITGNYNIKRINILEALYTRMNMFKAKKQKLLYSYALYDYYYQLITQYCMIKKSYITRNDIISKIYEEILKLKKEVFFNLYINPLKKVKLYLKLLNLNKLYKK